MINLLVALQAEARPIVRHFGLNGKPAVAGFRRYGNPEINLLVTGVGPVAMSSGVTLLGLECGDGHAAWINVGIAGHRQLPIGTSLLASKITDQPSGLCWYPPQVVSVALPRAELITVAQPLAEYPMSAAVEMEASGFYPTACRFATGELVQSLKVVSDNAEHPAALLNEALIGELIGGVIEPLADLMGQLVSLMNALSPLPVSERQHQAYWQQWRFSHAQQGQLTRLLHDYQLLTGGAPDREIFKAAPTGKALLIALEAELLARRIDYSPAAAPD